MYLVCAGYPDMVNNDRSFKLENRVILRCTIRDVSNEKQWMPIYDSHI